MSVKEAISACLRLLQGNDREECQIAAGALLGELQGPQAASYNSEMIAHKELIQLLVQQVTEPSVPATAEAAKVLEILSMGPAGRQVVCEAGGVAAFLQLLTRNNEGGQLQQRALGALEQLSAYPPAAAQAVDAMGQLLHLSSSAATATVRGRARAALVQLLACEDVQVQQNAASKLWLLTSNTASSRAGLPERDCLTQLVQLLSSADAAAGTRECAAALLLRLASDSSSNCSLMVDVGAIPAFAGLLECSRDPPLQALAAAGLCRLLDPAACAAATGNRGAGFAPTKQLLQRFTRKAEQQLEQLRSNLQQLGLGDGLGLGPVELKASIEQLQQQLEAEQQAGKQLQQQLEAKQWAGKELLEQLEALQLELQEVLLQKEQLQQQLEGQQQASDQQLLAPPPTPRQQVEQAQPYGPPNLQQESIEALVHLLTSERAAEVSAAAAELATRAKRGQHAGICSAGGVQALVQLVRIRGTEVHQQAAAALAALAKAGAAKEVHAAKAVGPLVHLLGCWDDEDVQCSAALALHHIAAGSSSRSSGGGSSGSGSGSSAATAIRLAKAIPQLAWLLTSRSLKLQLVAADVLKTLAAKEAESSAALAQLDGAAQLIVPLLQSQEPELQGTAASLLALAARQEPSFKPAVLGAGGVPLLVRLLDSADPMVQYHATAALSELANQQQAVQEAMSKGGAVPKLLKLLDDSRQEEMQRMALGALHRVAPCSSARAQLVREGAVDRLRRLKAVAASPDLRRAVDGALAALGSSTAVREAPVAYPDQYAVYAPHAVNARYAPAYHHTNPGGKWYA